MKYFAKKLFTLIITLFIVSLLAFLAFQVIPADVVTSRLGTNATPEQIEILKGELGLNRHVVIRYFEWMSNFLQGDMGKSFIYDIPVSEMIAEKLPVSGLLILFACFMTIAISIPIGIFLARHAGGVFDRVMTVLNQVFMSIPPVFLGILLFGLTSKLYSAEFSLHYSDNFGMLLLFMIFPALSIAISRISMTVKLLRISLLGEMDKNYIKTAYSRGHSRGSALRQHALKNAILPVIVFIAVSAAEMVVASIIVEQVFAIPGIGRLLIASIASRDFMVVQAIVVILATWVVLVNFIADIMVQYIDPRVRLD